MLGFLHLSTRPERTDPTAQSLSLLTPMTPLHTRCPELARTETRGFVIAAGGPVPAGTYGIIEWFCEDPGCDCRRAFLQIISEREPAKILASLNYGWETRAFYRRLLPFDPQAPKEITDGSLNPINPQSPFAPALHRVFQNVVATPDYQARLQRHYQTFKATLVPEPR